MLILGHDEGGVILELHMDCIDSKYPHGHTSMHLPQASHASRDNVKYIPGFGSITSVKLIAVQYIQHWRHPMHRPHEKHRSISARN